MKTYQLKIIWPDSRPIQTSCAFATVQDAKQWMSTALTICGKNEQGTPFKQAILAVIVSTRPH